MTLREMRDIDIKTIDRDKLVDFNDILINTDLPKEQRLTEMINQMNGNPYFFKSDDIVVKVQFANTTISLNERMEDYLRTL